MVRVLAVGHPAASPTPAGPAAHGANVPTSFADLGVSTDLTERLATLGIDAPFPVQELTLPDALAGRDLCGRAPTGSGKTLAFVLPAVERTGAARPGSPRALILVPTRELAAQVRDVALPLARLRGREVATVYGGTNIRKDQDRLRRGIDILVATPGRLADLVQRGDCDLGQVGFVVLDEADRMADMGFLPEVERLLDRTSADRQTLLFSATLDGDVDRLVRRYQRQPVHHAVDADPDERVDVRHLFWSAERHERRGLTGDILRRVDSAIVFTRTKHGADRLARQLATDGISTAAIHGNRNQNQRERALARFASGEVTTLVATDVAARGVHVDDVDAVVHYDLPGSDKDYVHRSGRTGRAGATGLVVSLVDPEQAAETASIQRSLDLPPGLHELDLDLIASAEVPAPVTALAARGGTAGRGGGGASRGDGQRAPAGRGTGGGRGGARAGRAGGRPDERRNGSTASTTAGGGPKGGARSSSRRRRGGGNT
jgi:superfamily II DNA/RNA helicase